jgi:hypothetical protein
MAYKEKNFQTEFKAQNKLFGCFELKLCKKTSLPFKNIAEHQIEALCKANSSEGLYHKLIDQPVSIQQAQNDKGMRFTRPSPFDCFKIRGTDAYVVIMFYEIRKKKNVYYIPITAFLEMQHRATRKSITEEMCEFYCMRSVSFLKKGGEDKRFITESGEELSIMLDDNKFFKAFEESLLHGKMAKKT